jgi:hypothetical protein
MSVELKTQERIECEAKKLVKCVGEEIRNYFNKYKVSEIYRFKFKIDDETLFTADDKEKIEKENNLFEKNVLLKQLVSEKLSELKTDGDKLRYYKWIVTNWGGIRTFSKKFSDVDFENSIKDEQSRKELFSVISSYSKIMSFLKPDEYFIYDSRVAYVLNWLLLMYSMSDNLYFPVPSGRNKNFIKYDIKEIIRRCSGYCNGNRKLYYDKQDAYLIYNSFILQLYGEITNEEVKAPYSIEMMLFALFDCVIDEIKKWRAWEGEKKEEGEEKTNEERKGQREKETDEDREEEWEEADWEEEWEEENREEEPEMRTSAVVRCAREGMGIDQLNPPPTREEIAYYEYVLVRLEEDKKRPRTKDVYISALNGSGMKRFDPPPTEEEKKSYKSMRKEIVMSEAQATAEGRTVKWEIPFD